MESESIPPDGEPLHQLLLSSIFQPVEWPAFVGIGVVMLLLVVSGLISGSEIAFFSLRPRDIQNLGQSDDGRDRAILHLLDRPRLLLSTILVANNFVNVAITILMFYIVREVLDMDRLPDYVGLLVTAAIVTPFMVLFGENTPKVYANQNNVGLARFTVRFIAVLRTLFAPISVLLVRSGLFFEKRFKRRTADIDFEEIEKAIEISADENSTLQDMAILKGIIHLGDTTVRQIMRPRMEMEALDVDWTFTKVIAVIRETGYSRFPVYEESIDNIRGVLYAKDLLAHLTRDDGFDWHDLIREATYVPETKKIDDLLREIQASRRHLVIVVDEYGGTQGLVSLEDILEEVVGDIQDEFDEESLRSTFRKLDDRNYIFEAKTTIHDVCKYLDVDTDAFDEARGEADSLGGLVLELVGRIPSKGDRVRHDRYEFIVLEMDTNRIVTVKLTIHDDD